MPSYLAAFAILPFLAQSTPIPDDGLLRRSTHSGTNVTAHPSISSRSIWKGTVISDELKNHWKAQKGGALGTGTWISPLKRMKEEMFITSKDGVKVPLIQLDCENTYNEGRMAKKGKGPMKYIGNYHDVCKNYLWWRYSSPACLTSKAFTDLKLPGPAIILRKRERMFLVM